MANNIVATSVFTLSGNPTNNKKSNLEQLIGKTVEAIAHTKLKTKYGPIPGTIIFFNGGSSLRLMPTEN